MDIFIDFVFVGLLVHGGVIAMMFGSGCREKVSDADY